MHRRGFRGTHGRAKIGAADPKHSGSWSSWQLGAFMAALVVMIVLGYVLLLVELGAVVAVSIYNYRRRRS